MGNKKRVVVLVSGGGTNLQAILDAQKSGVIQSGEVVLVLSNRKDAYALERAAQNGIPAKAIVKRKSAPEEFENKLTQAIEEAQADLIVLAGFLAILSPSFTEHFAGKIINIHPSLIPSFCGAGFYGLTVHEKALEKGVKVTGATVHYVNEIPDGGRILAQKAVEVQEGDTPEILQKRVMEQAEWIILPQTIEKLCRQMQEEDAK